MSHSVFLAVTYFVGIFLQYGASFAQSGSGIVEPSLPPPSPGERREPYSAAEIQKRFSCYITIATAARSQQTKCRRVLREDLCRTQVDCLWRGNQCSGAGLEKCFEVLRSQCDAIHMVAQVPSAAVALKRYHCDPDAVGRIIFTPKED